jgi:calcium permeable stress-gated cation channel
MFHELNAFVRIRQENLTADQHKNTVRATTILITSVPENFLNVNTLRQVFSVFPGGVKNVFLNRDCSELLERIEDRDKIARMLESAETDLIKMANKAHRKDIAKEKKEAKKRQPSEDVMELHTSTGGVQQRTETVDETEYLVDKYVPKKKRPTHRLPIAGFMPSLPLIGKKVYPSECC